MPTLLATSMAVKSSAYTSTSTSPRSRSTVLQTASTTASSGKNSTQPRASASPRSTTCRDGWTTNLPLDRKLAWLACSQLSDPIEGFQIERPTGGGPGFVIRYDVCPSRAGARTRENAIVVVESIGHGDSTSKLR